MSERFVTDSIQHPDKAFELTLRPPDFAAFVGQAKVKERLELSVEAARRRKEPVGRDSGAVFKRRRQSGT